MDSRFFKSAFTDPKLMEMILIKTKNEGTKEELKEAQIVTTISLAERINDFFRGYNETNTPCLIAACEVMAREYRNSFQTIGDLENDKAVNDMADELGRELREHMQTITVKNPYRKKD